MAKASSSESSTKENGADRGQRHGARRVHESYIRGWPVQAASVIRRDARHRWGAATGQGVMRFVVALLLDDRRRGGAGSEPDLTRMRWAATLAARSPTAVGNTTFYNEMAATLVARSRYRQQHHHLRFMGRRTGTVTTKH